jgi:pimeloyl-ACP methyl ester carboxylesterase
MTQDKPTVVLVHGAFAESASWNGVIQRLQAKSLTVVAAANPLRSVAGDAAYVRDVIAGIGKPIVLVAHSYGGFVITEAAAGNDSVAGLVYVCGFAPDHGESAFALAARFPGSRVGPDTVNAYPVSTGGNDLAIKQEVFHEIFVADVSSAQAALLGAAQRPATDVALTGPLPTDTPGWKTIPSWFVFGEKDLVIPAELHRFMAKRANAKGIREIAGASHALSVSEPEAVAASVLEAVNAVSAVGVTASA